LEFTINFEEDGRTRGGGIFHNVSHVLVKKSRVLLPSKLSNDSRRQREKRNKSIRRMMTLFVLVDSWNVKKKKKKQETLLSSCCAHFRLLILLVPHKKSKGLSFDLAHLRLCIKQRDAVVKKVAVAAAAVSQPSRTISKTSPPSPSF